MPKSKGKPVLGRNPRAIQKALVGRLKPKQKPRTAFLKRQQTPMTDTGADDGVDVFRSNGEQRPLPSPLQPVVTPFERPASRLFLENGGTIANAQAIAAHESPRTTKLYDRTSNDITLDEVERIVI